MASMYPVKPSDTDKIKAIPIIPTLPAKAVKSVLAFLDKRFLNER